MSLYQPEPVEISTRMRPGEWTEASLEELVNTYRQRIVEMGASVTDVVTDIDRGDDGSVRVAVSWDKPANAGDEDAVTGGQTL
jgi:ABC-type hemin transport system substrate-binding protein